MRGSVLGCWALAMGGLRVRLGYCCMLLQVPVGTLNPHKGTGEEEYEYKCGKQTELRGGIIVLH